jgi:hypothetical protein
VAAAAGRPKKDRSGLVNRSGMVAPPGGAKG